MTTRKGQGTVDYLCISIQVSLELTELYIKAWSRKKVGDYCWDHCALYPQVVARLKELHTMNDKVVCETKSLPMDLVLGILNCDCIVSLFPLYHNNQL
jgi:hypothetical protein